MIRNKTRNVALLTTMAAVALLLSLVGGSVTIAGATDLPAGTILFFNASACPAGWVEVIEARGRYLVGVPAGGAPGLPVGTPLSDGEDRPVGEHDHSVSDPGHSHALTDPGHSHEVSDPGHRHTILSTLHTHGGVLVSGVSYDDGSDYLDQSEGSTGEASSNFDVLPAVTGVTVVSATVSASLAIGNSFSGVAVEATGEVTGTNAPYVQLLACKRDTTPQAPMDAPAGTVAFFTLEACPTGWNTAGEAEGRYLVGAPAGGTQVGITVGAALSDGEERPAGQHTHTLTDPGHSHALSDNGHSHALSDNGHSHDWTQSEHTHSVDVREGPPNNAGDDGDTDHVSLFQTSPAVNDPEMPSLARTNITIVGNGSNVALGESQANLSLAAGRSGLTVREGGRVPGTNAPYIQFLLCYKDALPAGGAEAPANAVAFFDLPACPSGWSEFTAALGRYLVGNPAGGAVGQVVGVALVSGEERPVGQHNHLLTDPGHSHAIVDPGHSHAVSDPGHDHSTTEDPHDHGGVMVSGDDKGDRNDGDYAQEGDDLETDPAASDHTIMEATTGITLGNSVTGIAIDLNTTGIGLDASGAVAGTNAPYIQYLACQKQ
ncbi:MAG: hypothetical protein L0332_29650 [Chloroflexi bacterium]|nr:hypothetical protein [Chloroflexota bacterium]MCI0730865.1 hypothetical protein [Chloroflexota bacterium]